jgi:hypothetical protein
MKGRGQDRRGYLLGDVVLVLILLSTFIPGFMALSAGLRKGEERHHHILNSDAYPQRQFIWIIREEAADDK